MRALLGSIRYNLANLLRFSGRDRPGLFWPYAVSVVIAGAVAIQVAMIPTMRRAGAIAERYPDRSEILQGPGRYEVRFDPDVPEVGEMVAGFMIAVAIIAVVGVLLLAASVVRRLHDRGKSGWWGAPTGVLLLVTGFALMAAVFQGGEPSPGLFLAAFLTNILYLVAMAFLIVLLAGGSNPGENRFGPPPEPTS